MAALPLPISRAGNVQAMLIGMVDNKEHFDKLIQEQKLLHRESVFKLAANPGLTAPPPKLHYELRVRLGKTPTPPEISHLHHEKFVPPMSLTCLGDPLPYPSAADKLLKTEDGKRRLPRPSLRRMIEVDVGHTCDEFLKLFGFDVDFIFIRAGQQFVCGQQDRCIIMISEIHQLQSQQLTPKLEKDRDGKPVDNVYLVEIVAMSVDESSASVEIAVRDVLSVCEKLSPYVTLNCPEDLAKLPT